MTIKPHVAILDYNVGNLFKIGRALDYLGANFAFVSKGSTPLEDYTHLILPGVGAFGAAMQKLQEWNLDQYVRKFYQSGKPILGICLGMQLLFEASEESPNTAGLGILKGQVISLQKVLNKAEKSEISESTIEKVKIPHYGWNIVNCRTEGEQLLDSERYYFVHSYCALPSDPTIIVGETPLGAGLFTSAIAFNNLWATQFHPELSAAAGLKLLQRFVNAA